MIASPCNKTCVMNEATGLCRGCYRTLDEIARWGEMSDGERTRVMAELPGRHAPSATASAQQGASERPP
ncbi:MAG TPA: DUF1289 domain-containing protein, partial [Burkholderiales bacterium]|nr:DUF1289 domain-containing protein [Burkholderiales bacterium]